MLFVLGAACSKEDVKPDLAPRLGVLELPIAHRTEDPPPSGAAQIEVTPSGVLVDGELVVPLESGKLPAAERAGYDLPKLKVKLAGKQALAIGVYAAVPYATLARVLHSGLTAGMPVSFKVRRPNETSKTGWLTIPRSHFVASSENGEFEPDQLVAWDSFANAWEEALTACQVSARADCGYRPLAKAQGGKLELMLRVRGAGLALRFRQAGAPPVASGKPGAAVDGGKAEPKPRSKKRKRAELLDGVGGAAAVAEQAAAEPATEHVFTLRSDQATADPSPITGIVRPVCGAVSCPVVLDAEGITMSGQVLALIGAAFADGSPAPIVAWVLPPKEG